MKKIIFNHIETDEVVSPEFIAELHRMVAGRLFEAWRKDYEARNKKKNEDKDGLATAGVQC